MNHIPFLNSTTFLSKPVQTEGRVGLALGLAATIISAWYFEAPYDGVYKERFDWPVINRLAIQKSNVDNLGEWVVGQLIPESVLSLGTKPAHAKYVAMMNASSQVNTKGVLTPLKYTNNDNHGLVDLRAYTFDFQSNKFKSYGHYADYEK